MKSRLLGALCAGVFISLTMPSHAALVGRLPATPGGMDYRAYFDDKLDITWTTDASTMGLAPENLRWVFANEFAENLIFGGVGGWRLPSVDVNGNGAVVDCSASSEAACRDNEFEYMFWQNNISASNPGPFINVNTFIYWSGTRFERVPPTNEQLAFGSGFVSGGTFLFDITDLNNAFNVWAVHDGDVFIPIPAAVWLFGSGLLGLVGIARHKAA